jgi:hypothetical protein
VRVRVRVRVRVNVRVPAWYMELLAETLMLLTRKV